MSIHRALGRRKLFAVTAALAAGALALTGCAGSSEPSGSGGGEAPTEITVSVNQPLSSLDPAQLSNGNAALVWTGIYDTLLYLDNNGELQPNAVESWKYSDDALNLTLTLREGMTFSSGAPVNADVVKASFERTKSTPGPNQGVLSSLESVTAPDERTVVLKLSKPDANLLQSLAWSNGVIADPATVDAKETGLNPVGSGPYTLDTSASTTGSTTVLRKRDDYWNADAYPFKTVTVQVIADPTAVLNALQAGELDAATVRAQDQPAIKGSGQFTFNEVKALSNAKLVIADRAGELLKPLGDVRVRQAINMALDRDKMVKQLLQGAGVPTAQVFNPQGPAYVEDLEDTYKYDVQKAKALMAEAGYADGFDLKMPSFAYGIQFEPTITQALADIGIRVTWEPVPPQNNQAIIASKKYPMFFHQLGLAVPARDVQFNVEQNGVLNPFSSQDPELTDLIAQANAELDKDKAAKLYQEINRFIVEEAWMAPLFNVGVTWVTSEGITYLGNGSNPLPNIRAFGLTT